MFLLRRLTYRRFIDIASPEGYSIAANPLFHANLVATGSLRDYEPGLRLAIEGLTTPGMVAWDIGANIGVFTVLFAQLVGPEGMVYAFEPEPHNAACLRLTIDRNHLSQVRLLERALGNTSGTGVFDRRGGAFSGRLIGERPNYRPSRHTMRVDVAAADDLVKTESFRPPDIVKIDVEGNEGMVLSGMRSILANHRPVVLCEIHAHLGDSVGMVERILAEERYSVAPLDEALGVAEGQPNTWIQRRQILARPLRASSPPA